MTTQPLRAPWLGTYARYFLRDAFLAILLAQTAAIVLFVAIDLVEASNLVGAKLTTRKLLWLEVLSIPEIMSEVAAVSSAIGMTMAVGAQLKRGEISALFGFGATPRVWLKPCLLLSFALAGFFTLIVEGFGPSARIESQRLRNELNLPVRNAPWEARRQTWFRGGNAVYRVTRIDDTDAHILRDVLRVEQKQGQVLHRSDIAKAQYVDSTWVGYEVLARQFSSADNALTGRLNVERRQQMHLDLREKPSDLLQVLRAPEALSTPQLFAARSIRERRGQSVTPYALEIWRRLTLPAGLWVTLLWATAVGLRLGLRPSPARALAHGAALGFVIWLSYELAFATASTEMLGANTAYLSALTVCLLAAVFTWHKLGTEGLKSA